MKKYRIRENSPIAWIRDISIGAMMGLLLFGMFLMGL